MKLSQFDLVDCPAGNMTDVIGHGSSAESKWGNNNNVYYGDEGANDGKAASSASADTEPAFRGGSGKVQLNYVCKYHQRTRMEMDRYKMNV